MPSLLPLRAAQLGFWAAAIFTFVCAVLPPQHAVGLTPWDKASHFIAFYVVSVLAAAAFPRRSVLLLGVLLSAFGALIEVVQGWDFVGRDRDVMDWLADTIAILAAYGPMLLVAWREHFQRLLIRRSVE